jgi:hypothetical protein
MKRWFLALGVCACVGCTALSLERHTLAQTSSAVDLRYRLVLDNLALVADDPASLPNYSTIFAGLIEVTDEGQFISTTAWQFTKPATAGALAQGGFSSEMANPQLNRAVLQNWALDPMVVPEKLEAIRCACRWVLYGPENACKDCQGLLASPDQAPGPGRHFDVADRLAKLPPGWLHVGGIKEVPVRALYKAHSRDTWVWVIPEGMAGLAGFTLVLQDIARVDINSLTLFNIPPNPSFIRFFTSDCVCSNQVKLAATVAVDCNGMLTSDQTYYPWRWDNQGTDAHLRAQINSAGASASVGR